MDTGQEAEKHSEVQDFGSFVENLGLDIASALYANRPALETVYELLVSNILPRMHAPPDCPLCHRVGISVHWHVGQGTEPVDLREAFKAMSSYIWRCFSSWDESLLVLNGAVSMCLSSQAFIPTALHRTVQRPADIAAAWACFTSCLFFAGCVPWGEGDTGDALPRTRENVRADSP